MSFIQLKHINIHYIFLNENLLDSLEKPVLIFLHEGLGSIEQWKNIPELLSDELNLPALIYDRYGYGQSCQLKERRSTDYMHTEALNYLPELLQKLNISNKLILIGHSDGGSIALLYAASFPLLVGAVITLAAHVIFENISKKGVMQAIINYNEFNLKDMLEKYHGSNTESMFQSWADVWTSEEFSHWDIRNVLKSVHSPVLAIQGADDKYGTYLQLKYISESVSGKVETLMIPKCGHTPQLQRKEIVLPAIIDFILGL